MTAKRDQKIESMLVKLRKMRKRSEKALEKADRSLEKELKDFNTNRK